ncbi:MAG: hypothetical protein K2K01_08470 [Eubacterium sp.]|nr:hypothetical protein [Eubacterium sp.]
MKKFLISVIAVVLIVASVFGAFVVKNKFSEKSNFRINETSSLADVVGFYNDAVKKSKENQNFKLDIKTKVALEDINCQSALLVKVLSELIGYQVGDVRENTESFSFVNGVDQEKASATPLRVIQPADSYIESVHQNSLSMQSVLDGDEMILLSFNIAKETADLDTVTTAINPIIKGQEVTDKSAITALAPAHSDFIDVGDVLSTVVDMLGISNMVNGSSNQKSSSGGGVVGIAGGECSIGTTEISASIDKNELLNSVMISAPVELKANFKFMSQVIETSIRIRVEQSYDFKTE